MLQDFKNLYHLFQAILANLAYGFPSKKLKIVAITGTDGKTTTATLLYKVLVKAGYKVALISTVAAYIGKDEIDTGFHVTTPSSFSLQRLLKKIADMDYEFVVLEVTSHAIDQNRIWGIRPTYAGITNVTHEHLDYHKTYENYVRTKGRLLAGAKISYVNKDDQESFKILSQILPKAKVYDTHILGGSVLSAVRKRFGAQTYNFQNSALVVSIAKKIGVPEQDIGKAIASFQGVSGRMEKVTNTKGLHIIVDFAHTPNALEAALTSVRKTMRSKKAKLIVVFGCASQRDVTKRPLMGSIACEQADYVVLTSEDPRMENPWSIISQIKSGVKKGHEKIVSIADRKEAISFAIRKLANRGDTVIMCGKGHEKSMNLGGLELPWSDRKVVEKILKQ
ncbi:MAG TPA: UDP-N-acetylmuramoyl-L-alanyl-D-glutamate--2,6-diaminopimelate ligase [Patescibacteria group bacterium]|nr:UDP-N-acetylmuramoyl-L-alanyl-D-glutamate--2,6-diaminopimelate ligase [Patescibacteria group bacterium]